MADIPRYTGQTPVDSVMGYEMPSLQEWRTSNPLDMSNWNGWRGQAGALQSPEAMAYGSPMDALQPIDTSGFAAMMKTTPDVAAGAGGGWFSRAAAFGDTNPVTGASTGGWAMPAVQTFSSLANAWLGMKQYGMAKDALKEGKRQFDMNYDANKKTVNESQESRQVARLDATGGRVHTPVAQHMAQYGIA